MYHHLGLCRMLWEGKPQAEGQALPSEAKLLLLLRCLQEINMAAKVPLLRKAA